MPNNYHPIARRGDILEQEIDKEVLLYDLQANKAYCLNETTAEVYRLCDGRVTVTEMSRRLSIKLKTIVTEDFVLVALDELMQNGLLEDGAERTSLFGNVTRREMIRRAGLATMAALPIVTALSAPRAAQAQSATGCGNSCSSPTQCSQPCTCFGLGTCGPNLTSCNFIGQPCQAQGTCTVGPGTCSIPGGIGCTGGGTTCFFGGTCTGGICSAPGGVCPPGAANGSPCQAEGVCTIPPGICSIPGGTCQPGTPNGGPCSGPGTCVGSGTCQQVPT